MIKKIFLFFSQLALTFLIVGVILGQDNASSDLNKYNLQESIKAITVKLAVTGNKAEAKAEFEYLHKQYPDSAAIRYNIAVISEALEEWEEAEKWFKEYLASPKATPQRIAQAKIELENIAKIKALSPKEKDERSFKIALAKIELLADSGNFSEAFNLLKSYSATQQQNLEYIRFYERLSSGDKALTYLEEFKTNLNGFSSKELLSKSAVIWDFLSPKQYPEIIFPLAFAVAKEKEKPVVLDSRLVITPIGKCVLNQPAPQTLFNVEKESVKYQGKTVYKLAPSERLLNLSVNGAKITLLLNNKILTIQNNQKTFINIPESKSGKFIGKSTVYLHLADDKKQFFSITHSGLTQYDIDADSILDVVILENNNIAIASNKYIHIYDHNGKKIADVAVDFQQILKIVKGPNNSLLFITDKSLSKLDTNGDSNRISTLILGTFSNLSFFNSENSATLCTSNQDKFEISKMMDPNIGEFNSDKLLAENLLKEIIRFNELKAYDKAILKAIKIVEHFPNSESSVVVVRDLLRKLNK